MYSGILISGILISGIPESMYHCKWAICSFLVVTDPTNYIEIGEEEM